MNSKHTPIFSLKNFRSFGDDHNDFELAPITVLTGRNSSGKSSLVKAMLLLSKQLNQPLGSRCPDYFASAYFKTSFQGLNLGGFSSVINEQATDCMLTLSYRIWSVFLNEEVVCKRTYHKNENDGINIGKLCSLTIENTNGDKIYQGHFPTLEDRPTLEDIDLSDLPTLEEENETYVDENDLIISKYYKHGEWNHEIIEKSLNQSGLEYKEISSLIRDRGLNRFVWYDSLIAAIATRLVGETETEKEKKEREERHKANAYRTLVFDEIVAPWFLRDISYIDSSTNEIQRTYNVKNKDKFSQIIDRLINQNDREKEIMGNDDNLFQSSYTVTSKWLKLFGIGDSVEICRLWSDEESIQVYVNKDGKRKLLADEGYGITQLVSIILQLELCKPQLIVLDFNENEKYTLKRTKTIYIEEPEVHLHPQYQSMLAEMFAETYLNHGIRFVIETHSEYLIRKFQVLVADKDSKLKASDVSLNYVDKGLDGVATNRKIGIADDGRLMDSFGEGFFDEAGGLSRQLLKLSL